MIKKIFVLFLFFILSSCGGSSYRTGIKLKKTYKVKGGESNPFLVSDLVKLDNGQVISFYRPMGECGVGFTTFCILLPVIPIWFHFFNTCDNEIIINSGSSKIKDLKIKYNGKIYESFSKETKYIEHDSFKSTGYNTTFKFKIDNFKEFKSAKDKVLIVTTNDGFAQEIPIKWGFMRYNGWVVP